MTSRSHGYGRCHPLMACEIVSSNGAVFALWGRPTPEDMDRVKSALQTAANECGHPVVYITRVPVNAPPPDAASRARLDKMMPAIVLACSSYHVVLEGDGFGAAVKRGILTGLFQLSWRRKTFFVHASVNEVARNVESEQQRAVHAILDLAAKRGLLSGPAPGSLSPANGGSGHAA